MTIWLTNTATRKKEEFSPLDPQNVRMYVCGPTVYDRAHIGNARPVIVFDVLYRLLRHEYGPDQVTYVRNFTDVDDKINARAAESGRSIGDITAETTAWYLEDMAAIGALEPTHMPRATAYIAEMVAMIEDLIAKGHAYEAEGHVLFAVESWKEGYGKLSGRSVDDMIAGARVEVAPYKRNPMDFVMWKPSSDELPGWDSPWGRGRPGWHIECSAMAYDLLGDQFDIHGGGNDLMFPHHENEIAQSKCAGHGFARYWLHNEMLQVEGKKMSKSLGNFFTIRDLLDQGVPGEVIRFVFLSTHYRKPMDWTAEKADFAKKSLNRWRQLTKDVVAGDPAKEFVDLLCDDLNSAGAMNFLGHLGQVLFQKSGSWVPTDTTLADPEWRKLAEEFKASAQMVGLLTDSLGGWESVTVDLSSYADRLTSLREAAMQTKDFSTVDAMKTALTEAGVEVRMSKAGVELVPGSGFDAAKLEGL
ncbi:cysteine--tRNA ligase [Marivita sp. XM-24bin2]|jgi:cysteinyl-tRNA synthetase|uniref:cysteine--tRNA ligase n=1 Tax=unclassified Marivita TaxID=2632480 RepID=UPI000D79221C|nr:cysteine--tRNA ligase [Marivita sp. XM-24bin2]MCR9108086.1 cysteine--tRNA ligase [Paracoccaceae bacterium]PWL36019.1 MAG: cysteine--tRNA ligase [Marivita sp. XM-24bin2]